MYMSPLLAAFHIMLLATRSLAQPGSQPVPQPMDIRRMVGEQNVFIPCPFEFRSTPSIWRINGTDYTASTLPSIYRLAPSGLFITTVHRCLNHTSFQCIDTSSTSLQEELSDVGVLTVTGEEICNGELDGILNPTGVLRLDHRHIKYGSTNITLAWKIINSTCTNSRVLSYDECNSDTPNINITTEDRITILPSTDLRTASGDLADFSISSYSNQQQDCPMLISAVRFNVSETETINLLLGNNNCTCVEMESVGGLNFALSVSDPNQVDILCPILLYGNPCYSPAPCSVFKINGMVIPPFFRICETVDNTYMLCFGNISEYLNGLRLQFFTARRTICRESGTAYPVNTYIRSFDLVVARASSNISVNITSSEVCFTSSFSDCNLTDLTQYNVSIVDISGAEIFAEDNIPESECVIVSQLDLLQQCGPFRVITRPFNDYIVYIQETRNVPPDIPPTGDDSRVCSCLKTNVQLQLTAVYNSSIEVNYTCSTIYTTPINIKITDRSGLEYRTVCTNGSFRFALDDDHCGDVNLCGYFTNGTTLTDCPLACDSVSIACPTATTAEPCPTHFPPSTIAEIVVSVVLAFALCVIIGVLIIYVVIKRIRSGRADKKSKDVPLKDVKPQENGNDQHLKDSSSATARDSTP